MNREAGPSINLSNGRFSRFEQIGWWDQSRLARARVLVIGAGALGNEVIKNLSLLGIGHVAIVDMDRVERSNLSRAVLFRAGDEGQPKAVAAARAARDLYPEIHAHALVGNVLADVGLGWFRWADVVVGALDNREARLFVNGACALLGRVWIDGGIDVLNGIVRGFSPPATACYECTMGEADWAILAQRRSCALLARRAAVEGGTPTTPTMASVIGAIQAQEMLKMLHGREFLNGRGYVFEGLTHASYVVSYPLAPHCPRHTPPRAVEAEPALDAHAPLAQIARCASERLGGLDALDLSRELVESLECPACGRQRHLRKPLDAVGEQEALCAACGAECIPHMMHSLVADSELMCLSARQLGLPDWDIVWARCGERSVGFELRGDEEAAIVT
jgi:adenylyltransferase/sulfurtransferase